MAIAFDEAVSKEQFNNSADGVAAPAFNLASGNAVVVGISCQSATDITGTATLADTAGNTYNRVSTAAIKDATNNHQVVMFYAENTTANASNVVTATMGVTGWVSIVVFEFSGIETSSSLDASHEKSFGTGSAATSITSNTFSTVQADEVSVAMARAVADSNPFTAGSEDSGYTIPTNGDPDAGGGRSAMEYNIFSATKTDTTVSMSSATSTGWAIAGITLKASGGGASTWGPLLSTGRNRLVVG